MERRQKIGTAALFLVLGAMLIFFSGGFSFTGFIPDSCEWETLEIEGETFSDFNELEQAVIDESPYDSLQEFEQTAQENTDENIEFREGAENVEVTVEC